MSLKIEVTEKLSSIVNPERVISSEEALLIEDPKTVKGFSKAFGYVPDHLPLCIVQVETTDEVSAVLKYCNDNDVHVIAKTGASSAEDQLLVIDDRTIIVDGAPMNQILKIDTENMLVTAQCGVPLAQLENTLNEQGYTTGHTPQSLPLASLGGLVATRSTGQFSTMYGGIEDLVCGLEAVLPTGEVFRIRAVPRRAAGPDLRHLVIGAEGTIAFMTEVTMKLFKYDPDECWKGGYIVKDFKTGLSIIREVMVNGYKPAVARLYDKADIDRHYGSVKLMGEQAYLFFVYYGSKAINEAVGAFINEISLKYNAEYIGTKAIDNWFENRNQQCDTLGTESEKQKMRETRVLEFPVEMCATWSQIGQIYDEAKKTLPELIPNLVLLGAHGSHSYLNGTNLYFVVGLKIDDPAKASEEQSVFIYALCDIILKYDQAGIVHHHGIGKKRVGRIKQELGSSYILLKGIKDAFDPKGIMNPGCLLASE